MGMMAHIPGCSNQIPLSPNEPSMVAHVGNSLDFK
jgi:hypothetical protein